MNKIVINCSWGGFRLSDKAIKRFIELAPSHSCIEDGYLEDSSIDRHDPILVQVVEELGLEANGDMSKLGIVEISGNLYFINEYDGKESVRTPDNYNNYWIKIE